MKRRAQLFKDYGSATFHERRKNTGLRSRRRGDCRHICTRDTVRSESVTAIADLIAEGIYTVMISGDNEGTAKLIAEETKLNGYYANCMPEDKVAIIEKLKEQFGYVGMVGDGINEHYPH